MIKSLVAFNLDYANKSYELSMVCPSIYSWLFFGNLFNKLKTGERRGKWGVDNKNHYIMDNQF